jgi:hypothetical protein
MAPMGNHPSPGRGRERGWRRPRERRQQRAHARRNWTASSREPRSLPSFSILIPSSNRMTASSTSSAALSGDLSESERGCRRRPGHILRWREGRLAGVRDLLCLVVPPCAPVVLPQRRCILRDLATAEIPAAVVNSAYGHWWVTTLRSPPNYVKTMGASSLPMAPAACRPSIRSDLGTPHARKGSGHCGLAEGMEVFRIFRNKPLFL